MPGAHLLVLGLVPACHEVGIGIPSWEPSPLGQVQHMCGHESCTFWWWPRATVTWSCISGATDWWCEQDIDVWQAETILAGSCAYTQSMAILQDKVAAVWSRDTVLSVDPLAYPGFVASKSGVGIQ
ncbi:hypothetical protein LIA77_11192 [Sarocladium implicatum]|nr:hypothetical protein LIA77_11192 [Sarocladium implicatum]